MVTGGNNLVISFDLGAEIPRTSRIAAQELLLSAQFREIGNSGCTGNAAFPLSPKGIKLAP